jgi:hypothetical protein
MRQAEEGFGGRETGNEQKGERGPRNTRMTRKTDEEFGSQKTGKMSRESTREAAEEFGSRGTGKWEWRAWFLGFRI